MAAGFLILVTPALALWLIMAMAFVERSWVDPATAPEVEPEPRTADPTAGGVD